MYTDSSEKTQPSQQHEQPYEQPLYSDPYMVPYATPIMQYNVDDSDRQDIQVSDWSHNMCDCLDDFPICLTGLCCGGFVTSTTRAKMETREPEIADHCLGCILCLSTYGFGFWCCQSLVEYNNRRLIETTFNMVEREKDNNKDMLMSCCCLPCVMCQHSREIKERMMRGEFNFVKM